jgi:hypothetical protein
MIHLNVNLHLFAPEFLKRKMEDQTLDRNIKDFRPLELGVCRTTVPITPELLEGLLSKRHHVYFSEIQMYFKMREETPFTAQEKWEDCELHLFGKMSGHPEMIESEYQETIKKLESFGFKICNDALFFYGIITQ